MIGKQEKRKKTLLCHLTKKTWFSHIAVEVPGEETSNEWLEPVTDDEYNKLKQYKKNKKFKISSNSYK